MLSWAFSSNLYLTVFNCLTSFFHCFVFFFVYFLHMAHFSSGESSKPCSPQKAALYEDLKNAKQSNVHYLEVIRKMEAGSLVDFNDNHTPDPFCLGSCISSIETLCTCKDKGVPFALRRSSQS